MLAAASLQLASVKDKQHTKGEQESHPLVGAPGTQELGLGRNRALSATPGISMQNTQESLSVVIFTGKLHHAFEI